MQTIIEAEKAYLSYNYTTANDLLQSLINNDTNIDNDTKLKINVNKAISTYRINSKSNNNSTNNLINELTELLNNHDLSNYENINENNKIKSSSSPSSSSSVDNLLIGNTFKSVVTLFNLASLHFHQHNYIESRNILLKINLLLPNDNINTDHFSIGLKLKATFLHIEVLLKLWSRNGCVYLLDEMHSFQTELFSLLSHLSKYPLLIKSIYKDIKILDEINNAVRMPVLQIIILLRLCIYRGRTLIIFNRLHAAELEITQAIDVYEKLLGPMIKLIVSPPPDQIVSLPLEGPFFFLKSFVGTIIPTPTAIASDCITMQVQHQRQLCLATKAHLEYCKGNYDKSLSLLTEIGRHGNKSGEFPTTIQDITANNQPIPTELFDENGGNFNLELYNNIACLYMKMNKFSVASLYYRRSLQLSSSSVKSNNNQSSNSDSDSNSDNNNSNNNSNNSISGNDKNENESPLKSNFQPIYKDSLRHDYSVDILYNYGLSLLSAGNSLDSFQIFESLCDKLGEKPHLWIRMGECCIQYNSQLLDEENENDAASPFIEGIISSGRSRRLLLRYLF
jgi:tetratricopeptide (TPR) repeat protein